MTYFVQFHEFIFGYLYLNKIILYPTWVRYRQGFYILLGYFMYYEH